METLINSLYLLSMYYMNSNNITMHKFGIENNYISMAMNTMLGKTNNTVKSMNISETNAMTLDYSWQCISNIVLVSADILLISLDIASVILFPEAAIGEVWLFFLEINFSIPADILGIAPSC